MKRKEIIEGKIRIYKNDSGKKYIVHFLFDFFLFIIHGHQFLSAVKNKCRYKNKLNVREWNEYICLFIYLYFVDIYRKPFYLFIYFYFFIIPFINTRKKKKIK